MTRQGLILIAVVVLVAAPALAEKGDVVLRFGLAQTMPTGDLTETEGAEQVTIEADDTTGGGFSVEYMATDLFGVAAGIGFSKPDVKGTYTAPAINESATVGEATMVPLSIAANFHVKRTEKIDFYIGPEIAAVFYGDLEVNAPEVEDLELEDDFAFGANLGLDVPFSQRWMFCTNLKFLKTSADPEEGGSGMDIDPWTVGVGFGVKF